jgi:ferritin-like metal-binding protein YciE
MATTHERLMQWLRDADAMEKHAEAMLGALAQRIENYEEVKAQIERHLREAQEQAIALEEYVERRRCEDTSAWKDSPEQRAAFGHGFSCAFGGNEFIRRAITEISCYNVLIGAAAAAGGSETRAICEDILHREEAMLD